MSTRQRPARTRIRRLAIGRLISITGGAAAYTALNFTVWDRTHSPSMQALSLLLTFGVAGLLGSFAGALGDRFDRRNVMIWSEAISASFFQEEIARSAYEQQRRVEKGDTVIVGVNKHTDESQPLLVPAPDFSALAGEQVKRLRQVRAARDDQRISSVLGTLRGAAHGYVGGVNGAREPLMPILIDAVRARASVGEISGVLSAEWGTYRASAT